MSAQMLLCPGCRARVLENWTECKFCGQALTAEPIGATVHPDDLTAPPVNEPLASAPAQPTPDVTSAGPGAHDWSQWINEPEAPEPADSTDFLPPPPAQAADDFDFPVPPEPPDWNAPASATAPPPPTSSASSWDESPTEQANLQSSMPTPEPPSAGGHGSVDGGGGWGNATQPDLPPPPFESSAASGWDAPSGSGGALEPVEGANTQWVAGPAPIVPGADDDLGPSGLDPVSWYTEPGSEPAAQVADSAGSGPGPSLFGGPGLADDHGVHDPNTRDGGAHDDPRNDGERFDPTAIFRDDPEPVATGSGALERQEAPGEIAVQWKPASADAWNQVAEPEGTPKGQAVLSREVRLLAIGILAVVVIGLVANALLDRRNNYPSGWAPDVQAVATWVTHERGLDFKHAVAVKTVDSGEYDRQLAEVEEPRGDKAKQSLANRTAALRALGAVQGSPTGSIAPALFTDSGSGAFYDIRTDQLVIRHGTNASNLKVAVAGALSVALDNQYGDLSSLRNTSLTETPLLAVVAGNASMTRAKYLAAQSSDFRADVAAHEPRPREVGASFEAAQARLTVGIGNGLVSLVRNVRSVADVNEMNTIPPSSDQQVFDPTVYLAGQRPLTAQAPTVPPDAKQLDAGTIGAATWYLVLGQRLDSQRAFTAVEVWAGDSFVTYLRPNGQVCVADTLRAADDNSANALIDTLKAWRGQVPGDHITITQQANDQVLVTTCDPGASAAQGLDAGYGQVVDAGVTRSLLAANYYQKGTTVPNGPNGPILTPTQAWCMANRVVGKSSAGELTVIAAGRGDLYKSRTLEAGSACGSNLVAQLFQTS